jgi:hypothetical protein
MDGCPSAESDSLGFRWQERRPDMDYFGGLDISMDQTHICVLDQEGDVVL